MSKVIFKLSFKSPNFTDTKTKNVSHVNYIATRSGVDKTVTEADLAKELEKGVEHLTSNDQMYLKYINERPRSHGLFGAEGIADPKVIQEEISQVESFVWRGIVSLKEDDAQNLGYLDKDKWQTMLRKMMPDVAEQMGIRFTNLRWVGAVHMEKGHPHAHVMVWEEAPEKTVGVINSKRVNNIRKIFTDEIFEEQRFQLLNEKNIMRELIRDLAKNDIGEASRLIKEVRATGTDLNELLSIGKVGIEPRLYSDEEKYLIEKVRNLSDIMPRKGRVALKFMPENVKSEVRAIADHLLEHPELGASLAKNLQAAEDLAKFYTGKDDAIEKARENAYQDIRDRLCQVILRGAAESKKDNLLYVHQEKSAHAVEVIRGLNQQINLLPEQIQVFEKIISVLERTGHNDTQIIKALENYAINENIHLSKDILYQLVQKQAKDTSALNTNAFNSSKNLDFYLTGLKMAGYSDQEALQRLKDGIATNSQALTHSLNQLKESGFLKSPVDGESFQLTDRGIHELLRTKELDRVEREIFTVLEASEEEGIKSTFSELLERKGLTENLRDPYPAEFRVSRFDLSIQELFGDNNRLTLDDLEKITYGKYTLTKLVDGNISHATDEESAAKEFEIYKNRLDRLAANGFTLFDRSTGVYSFTEKGMEALQDVPSGIQFTKYDATVTLGYIDKADGTLTSDQLRTFLEKGTDPKELDREFANVVRRLNGLKKMGYLEGSVGEYRITDAGALKRDDLLKPEKQLLKNKLQYLERLGLIQTTDEGYKLTATYTKYMQDVAAAKEQHQVRLGTFSKDIADLLDRTQGRINPEKLASIEERSATEKYLKGVYDELKTDYQSLRTAAGVVDLSAKTIHSMAIALLVSGLSREETTATILTWNTRSGTNFDQEQLGKIIDKAHTTVEDNHIWDRTTVISVNDWKAMFDAFGISQQDIPKWIYQGQNWQVFTGGLGMAALVNDMWKSTWRALEQQRMQTQAQAEMMKKQLAKQAGLNSKQAMVEQVRKHRDRSLYRESELEL